MLNVNNFEACTLSKPDMRAKTLQVVWHDKKPVFSLDFHPSGLLATGGGDNDVKLWKVVWG